jgi:hypothetical protein
MLVLVTLALVTLPVAVTEEFERPDEVARPEVDDEVTRPVVDIADPLEVVLLDGARLYSSRRLPAPQYSNFVSY